MGTGELGPTGANPVLGADFNMKALLRTGQRGVLVFLDAEL